MSPTSPGLEGQTPRVLRILLLENVHPSAAEILRAQGHAVEELKTALKESELAARLKEVDVLGIRSKTQVRGAVLEAAPHLLAIGAFCIGTNQIELDAAKRAGTVVFNAPFSNTRSVAEMVIAEIIMLARQIGDRSREVHEGNWKKAANGCFEVRGKTLGIVGYGHIGSQVGVLAEAMGLRVLSYDIRTTMAIGNAQAQNSLDELLAQSDFVTLHVPETPQTQNMIGERELSIMKRGSYLLNASRGTVLDVPALAKTLKSGHIAGAAVDVYPEEPESNSPGFSSPLQGLPNVILTPHVGGSTEEAQAAIGKEVATSLSRFLQTGTTIGAVNFPPCELPLVPSTHRIVNVHRNVPGVLRDINRIVSERNANIHSQLLSTDASVGYLIMDLDQNVAAEVARDIGALETNIRTRVIA
ncbi:MAG: phosphoglycerate dehydrogenase [Polyangiaceae bacterium]